MFADKETKLLLTFFIASSLKIGQKIFPFSASLKLVKQRLHNYVTLVEYFYSPLNLIIAEEYFLET